MRPTTRPARRFRLRPFRLVAALLVFGALGYLLLIAPRQLWFALSLPAPSPLTAHALPQFGQAGAAPYQGRCLALHISPSGTMFAAVAEEGGLLIYALGPEGSAAKVQARVPGEPLAAAFFGERSLAVWCRGGADGGGRLVGFANVPDGITARSSLTANWNQDPGLHTVLFQPLAAAVAVIGAGSDGVLSTCLVLGPDGSAQYREVLDGGLFTAWGSAIPAGGLTLAGAAYTETGMQPFVRHLGPDFRLLFSAVTADGPPMQLAVSPTGKYVLAVTPRQVVLWHSDGSVAFARRFTGSRAALAHALSDGYVLLSSVETTLALNQRGQVVRRWRALAPGPVEPASGDLALLSLPGGGALLNSAGALQGIALWDGPGELAAIDSSGQWLGRAGGGSLTIYRLAGRPAAP